MSNTNSQDEKTVKNWLMANAIGLSLCAGTWCGMTALNNTVVGNLFPQRGAIHAAANNGTNPEPILWWTIEIVGTVGVATASFWGMLIGNVVGISANEVRSKKS
jgi:hypothetical protein